MSRYKYKIFVLAVLLSRNTDEKAVRARVIREILSTVFMMRRPHQPIIDDNLAGMESDGLVRKVTRDGIAYWYITNDGTQRASELITTEITDITKQLNEFEIIRKGLEKCRDSNIDDYIYDTLEQRVILK